MSVVIPEVVCAAIIRPDGLVVVKKGDLWILPGGKKHPGESDAQCLDREIRQEELTGVMRLRFFPRNPVWEEEVEAKEYFMKLEGVTPFSGHFVKVTVHRVEMEGAYVQANPRSEITGYLVTAQPELLPLSPITRRVVDLLRDRGEYGFGQT